MTDCVQILAPLPMERLLTYALDPGDYAPGDYAPGAPESGAPESGVHEPGAPPLGALATVNVAGRTMTGCLWRRGGGSSPPLRLKTARLLAGAPPLGEGLRHFIDWAADWTCAPRGLFLKSAIAAAPSGRRVRRAAAPESGVKGSHEGDGAGGGQGGAGSGAMGAGNGGIVQEPPWSLTGAQREAASSLAASVGGGFSVTLLDGVTGSGKTLVYAEAVAQALRSGGQALVLVPEIALTGQWLATFERRFGCAPLVWHSALGAAARRRVWLAAASGQASVVVGARSALFLPMPKLALLVIDEEHDPAFKQEDGLLYHARDLAVARARCERAAVVLASATPSLETLVNVERGKYRRLALPARYGGRPLPKVELVDMRRQNMERGRWISPPLRRAMAAALDGGGQCLLFLNRRGYAPLALCRACGEAVRGPGCGNALALHRGGGGRLLCHYCGYSIKVPDACPSCGDAGGLSPCGPGVERLEEETRRCFPHARLAVMSSDLSPAARGAALIEEVSAGRLDILIGTQMTAKGHHFPQLALVGVVDADLGLAGGDLRAAERTFQLLHQVGGRAGRGERPGVVYLQTSAPQHDVMLALATHDREGFLRAESRARRQLHMPPYGRLAALIVSGRERDAVADAARRLAASAPLEPGVEVLGPAPARVLRGRWRWRLLARRKDAAALSPYMRRWLAASAAAKAAKVKVQVDIDPLSFF